MGGQLADVSSPWLAVAGSFVVVGLIPAMVAARARGNSFVVRVGALCLMASVVGFWSVIQIRGAIGDYHVFWLSLLGAVNFAVVIGGLLPIPVSLRVPPERRVRSSRWQVPRVW